MAAQLTIVVTGATGFLGGHCAIELANRRGAGAGCSIIATGRDSTKLANLRQAGIATEQLDLTSSDASSRLAEHRPHVFVHTAALSSPWGQRKDFHASNVAATEAVLQACASTGAALVHVSTPTIYMNGRDRLMINEDAALPDAFINDYAATKHAAELLVQESGVRSAVLRPQAIIGSGDTTVAPRFERIADRGVFPMVRGRDPVLDMTHVRNVVAAIDLCCDRLVTNTWAGSETFNISNGDPRPVSELAAAFLHARAAAAGRPVRTVRLPLPLLRSVAKLAEAASGNKREPAVTQYAVELLSTSRTLNIDKARALLNYDPSAHTIEQAFADYFASTTR